jgi:ferric-dicitrate binding protein FerR (iron transport regulator)
MNQAERIGKLVLRHTCKESTPEEEAELLTWRRSSPKNELLFQEETDPQQLASEIQRMQESKEVIFKGIMARYPFPVPVVEIKQQRMNKVLRIAAIFLLVLGAGLYLLLRGGSASRTGNYEAVFVDADGAATALDDIHRGWLAGYAGIRFEKDTNGDLIYIVSDHPEMTRDKYYTLYTAKNGKLRLRLPDSSVVWLNSGSSIKYPAHFAGNPVRVFIEGEAYVELAERPNARLLIMLRGMQVEAKAGCFNVKAYRDSVVSLTSLDGNLYIRKDPKPGRAPSELMLEAGQQVRTVGDTLLVFKDVDVNAVISWRDKRPGVHIAE